MVNENVHWEGLLLVNRHLERSGLHYRNVYTF
jgi:hypothetical protein